MKFFAHRGFISDRASENSVAALNLAHKNNFCGTEFDAWFINNEFVLSHDMPNSDSIKKLPRLKDYLIFKDNFQYWIDFKNLDKSNIRGASSLLKKEILASKINSKNIFLAPFIAEINRDALMIYDFLRNSYEGTQIMALCVNLPIENRISYHQKLQKNNIKFLSILHKNIDKNFMQEFSDIEIFAWTVNEISRLKELEQLGVANVTSDIITPKIYEQSR